MRLARSVFLCLFFWSPVQSAMREVTPGPEKGAASAPPSTFSPAAVPDDPKTDSPRRGKWWRELSFLAGPSILKDQVGIGLGLRGPITENFSWDLGGIIPHPVTGYAHEQRGPFTVGSFTETDNARVESFGEAHLAVIYSFYRKERVTLDAGLGISLGIVSNPIEQQFSASGVPIGTFTAKNHKVRLSPLVQAGAGLALTKRLSFLLNLAWVRYDNSETLNSQSFDLGFSGLLVNPMLQIKL